MINYNKRISKVRKIMQENRIDVLFLPPSGDAEYLTGIKRPAIQPTHTHADGDWLSGAFITCDKAIYAISKMPKDFIINQLSDKSIIEDVVVLEEGKDCFAYINDVLSVLKIQITKIATPKSAMAKTLINLKKHLPGIQFCCTEDFTRQMRMVKEQEEIEIMRKATRITDEIFETVVKKIKPGITEMEIAREINYQMLLKGAQGQSFTTDIIFNGPNVKEIGSFGGGSGFAVLGVGCNIAFDFGLVIDGFCSDFGRTIYMGEPSDEQKRVHELVMRSQKVAIEAMIPNKITAEQLNQLARDVIAEGGYDKEFIHRLGHGIGMDVHEYPYLSVGYDEMLQENMTFTIEPSVIVPGEFRIRVEDIVLVTPDGGECLNKASKDLIVIE